MTSAAGRIIFSISVAALIVSMLQTARGEPAPPAPVSDAHVPGLCQGDARDFARAAEKTVDFAARFDRLDTHIRRLAAHFELRKNLSADQMKAHDTGLLLQADEAIHLLGRLLPFESDDSGRPDMADFTDRIYFNQIDLPDTTDPDTIMRIAFAREALDAYPDSGRRIIRFMTDLDLTRNLLEIQTGGKATPTEQDALLEIPRILLETYEEDLRPVFEQTISGAYHTDLSTRLATRLSRLCTERALALEIEAKSAKGAGHE